MVVEVRLPESTAYSTLTGAVAGAARRTSTVGDVVLSSPLPLFAVKATVCEGSQFFYDTAGSADKTLKLYKDHFHDLLADTGKEGVMADITAWIDKHLP